MDAVLTIPKGTLFPMCGMNLAFNRELIGPAMYFGLMGDGQPIGRYDDMWAGWCMKVSLKISLRVHFHYLLLVHFIDFAIKTHCLVFSNFSGSHELSLLVL